jgi:hypothetical protein
MVQDKFAVQEDSFPAVGFAAKVGLLASQPRRKDASCQPVAEEGSCRAGCGLEGGTPLVLRGALSTMDPPPHSTSPNPSKVASNETVLEKGWISKRMKNSAALGKLSIVPTEEASFFNLSDSGSFREGLLHISQDGTTVHSSRSAEPSSSTGQWAMMSSPGSCRSTTSAKRANYQEEVRFELNRGDFENMEIIGKGSSGFVRKALRKSSNEILALKVINVFEEEKRKQMMQEVVMMCDARVPSPPVPSSLSSPPCRRCCDVAAPARPRATCIGARQPHMS